MLDPGGEKKREVTPTPLENHFINARTVAR